MKRGTNTKPNANTVGADASVRLHSKGITLIALIITIIVMLILVGVTVTVALNGGLFSTAKEAVNKTQVEIDRETLQSAVITAYDAKTGAVSKQTLETELGTEWQVSGENGGPYTATSPKENKFKVSTDGTIKEIIIRNSTPLERYIFGENGEGNVELFGEEGSTGILSSEFAFINIPEEVSNNGTLEFKTYALVETSDELVGESNGFIVDIYFTYDGETYKFRTLVDANFESGKTLADIGVKNISYDTTTKVGKTVNYDSKNWIILYDDSEHGLQMISEDTLTNNGSNIRLGYNDPTLEGKTITAFSENKNTSNLNLEKAVYSYNNAIKTLNDACDGIVTKNDAIISVRSVGSKAIGDAYTDDAELYTQRKGDTNTHLITWPESNSNYNAGVGNGKGKATDLNYEEDFDRMVALGINQTTSEYWLASRMIGLNLYDVSFAVRFVNYGLARWRWPVDY